MNSPPVHRPKPSLAKGFAADPFDKRLRYSDMRHTPLGLIAEALWWLWTASHAELDNTTPWENSFEDCLRREAPDVLKELEELDHE